MLHRSTQYFTVFAFVDYFAVVYLRIQQFSNATYRFYQAGLLFAKIFNEISSELIFLI